MEKWKFLTLPGFELAPLLVVQPIVSRYTDWAIPARYWQRIYVNYKLTNYKWFINHPLKIMGEFHNSSHRQSDSESGPLHLTSMVKLQDKIQAMYAAPMTPLLLVGSSYLCSCASSLYTAVWILAAINMRLKRWSISPFDAGHTSVASACCVVSLQALTPPQLNPERDPEWHYQHHRICLPFCTFPMPLWLNYDFAYKNVTGLGIHPEVKNTHIKGSQVWRFLFPYYAGNSIC
jgi:hypothetical protein